MAVANVKADQYWDRHVADPHPIAPNQYHDPATTLMPLTGTRVSDALPPGIWGAKGVIVKRSDDMGAPLGYNPNAVATEVHVDPDIPGQSFIINPTLMKKQAMADAMRDLEAGVATSVEDRRLQAASVFARFAVDPNTTEQPMVQAPQQPPQQPPNPGLQGVQTGVLPVADPRALGATYPDTSQWPAHSTQPYPYPAPPAAVEVKEASFQQQQPPAAPAGLLQPAYAVPQSGNGSPQNLFDNLGTAAPQARPVAVAVALPPMAPQYQASFQVRSSPLKLDAYFHQIIRSGSNLVFVFDRRAVGYPKMMPQMVDDDVAIHVAGTNIIYITQTTGIEFPCDDYDVCVVLIKDEHPYTKE